jgi:serine/threonine-protein kinase
MADTPPEADETDAIPAGGRFSTVTTIGQGAMGEVLLARERTLGRNVALKRILPERLGERLLVEHFEREARITAQLDHPGIVPVYEMTRQGDGSLAYTMKVVRGDTLQALVTRCREAVLAGAAVPEDQDLPARLGHFVKVCEAVHYAHERGFIHRDLKPANIMIGPFSEVYVMDWGIARPIDQPDTVEGARALAAGEGSDVHLAADETTVVLGTPRYMAPEQARGEQKNLGPHSDQYSLGLILQELVTLQPAIPGEGPATLVGFAADGIRKHPRPLAEHRHLDPELRAIVDKACGLQPADRYPSVRVLAADVVRYLGGREVTARPDNAWQTAARWFALHKQVTMLVMVALLTTIFASSTAFLLWQRAEREAALAREAALTAVITLAGERSHIIYEHLLLYEGLVHALATGAQQALTHPPAPGHTAYTEADFDAGAVPGLAASDRYGKPVSTEWPVFVLPAGEPPEQVARVVERMASLGPPMRAAALRSAGQKIRGLDAAALDRLIRGEGIPLVAAYVGLEQGVHVSWPGKGGYPDGYDPRSRPWYTESVADGDPQPRWHTPYVDALGQGVVMPCTMPVFDPDGALLGVAGVELTMGTVMDELLQLHAPGVEAVWLLDDQGRVLAPRDAAQASLEPFHLPEVVASVVSGRSGWLEGLGPDGDTLAITFALGDEGLAYVVEGDLPTMLAGGGER